MKFSRLANLLFVLSTNGQVNLEVNANQEGTVMSQALIGALFEDINYGANGGLYAELVQNCSF